MPLDGRDEEDFAASASPVAFTQGHASHDFSIESAVEAMEKARREFRDLKEAYQNRVLLVSQEVWDGLTRVRPNTIPESPERLTGMRVEVCKLLPWTDEKGEVVHAVEVEIPRIDFQSPFPIVPYLPVLSTDQ